MIEGNMIPGGGKYGIKLGATATNCAVLGNILAGAWTSAAFADNGTGSLTLNNLGINPLGKIPIPINTTNNTVGTNGTASTPVASTSYTVQGAPITVNSTGGTGVNITITDGGGNTVLSGLTTLSGQRLPYGWKINFGAFTAAPTVAVFAE
jgi:hypothetical protein